MEALKAQVKNGRLVLDEPTDLSEGSVVPLQVADDWDELDDKERGAVREEIAASISERRAGAPTCSSDEVLAEISRR